MALIKCSECGAKVSDKAPKCPHCGSEFNDEEFELKQEQKQRTKRKIIVFVVGWLVVAGLAAGAFLIYNAYKDAKRAEVLEFVAKHTTSIESLRSFLPGTVWKENSEDWGYKLKFNDYSTVTMSVGGREKGTYSYYITNDRNNIVIKWDMGESKEDGTTIHKTASCSIGSNMVCSIATVKKRWGFYPSLDKRDELLMYDEIFKYK